jgi:ubiquinone/menaquinone biosynthesis C-methylase UbiE
MNKRKVLDVYGDSADTVYAAFMNDYVCGIEQDSRDAYAVLFEQLNLKASQRALEVGIGTGRNIHRYPLDISLVGVDLTPQMLEMAEERVKELERENVELIAHDATCLPFEDNHFDAAVSTYTLCVTENPQQVLDEIVRVCKPGGRIGLYDCRRATSNPYIFKSQRFLADTMQTVGLFFDGKSAVIYDILFPLDALVEKSGLKVVDKRIMEFGSVECLGMYVLEK